MLENDAFLGIDIFQSFTQTHVPETPLVLGKLGHLVTVSMEYINYGNRNATLS